jgi:hypothetical protein
LSAWFEKNPPPADATCTSPRDAAVRAVLAAVNAAKPGTVRVAAADATLARQCREFVLAFFDTPKLKPLFLRSSGDGIELRSGVSIQVDSNVAKLSHGAIATIELTGGPVGAAPVELKSDAEIARDVAHILLIESNGGTGNEADRLIALNIARLLRPDMDPEATIQSFGKRDDDARDEMRWAAWRACQKAPFPGSSLEQYEQFAQPDTSKTPIVPHGSIDASGYSRRYSSAGRVRFATGSKTSVPSVSQA